MANYNASGLITLAKLAEETKVKKEETKKETKEVCDNTEKQQECVKRMIEAFSDCD